MTRERVKNNTGCWYFFIINFAYTAALKFDFITDVWNDQSGFAKLYLTGLVIVIMVDVDRSTEYVFHLKREYTWALVVIDAIIYR